MIAIIALAVLFIFFCVLAFMSAKNWLLRHVFLLLGVFIMTMVFMVFAAMTLQTHKVWKSRHAKMTAEFERTERRITELSGPLEISDGEESLPQLQADLSRLLFERGRVWRGARLAGVDGDAIQLDMSAWGNSGCVRAGVDEGPRPVADDGAVDPVAASPQITEKTLVHAFVEDNVDELSAESRTALYGENGPAAERRGPCTIPAAYAGHYLVTAIAENGITLKPLQPLDDKQLAMLDAGGSWSLYEVLPMDDHTSFAGLTEESVQALMSPLAGGIAPEQITAAARDFLRDGSPAEPDDPPERVWVPVKFLVDHSIQVDIEAEAAADGDRSFDVRGRAIAANLRQGAASEFKAGDIAEFDSTTANQLVQEEKCELVNEPSTYVRVLRNYELIFRNAFDAIADVQEAIVQTTAENATLTASTEQVRQQIAYREQEQRKLGEDLADFRRDGDVIASYRNDLLARRQLQLQELGRLYETNNQLRSQMSGL